jgi:hypothetical protein
MLAEVLSRAHGDTQSEAAAGGQRELMLTALARCVEAVAMLAPLKITAGSGVLDAVPLLLAEAAEDDVVQLAALDIVAAVIARRERVDSQSPEGGQLWALMRHVLQAAAGTALFPDPFRI